MASTMVPDAADRPDVLPSERLLPNGMAIPALRADLRRIDNARNALSVAAVWFWVALIIGGAVWIDQWWSYLVAFVLMGPMYARFAILMHEAAHKLLFTNKRWNDWIGKWVVAYPVFTPVQLYRRVHFAHHKDEFGPDEPDIAFYAPYPCTRRCAVPAPVPRRGRHQRMEELRAAGQEHGAPRPVPPHRPLHPRRPGSAVGGHVGRHRSLVDLPAPVVAALDDRVARDQPPALHRRARGHGAQPGPPGHDAQRAPVAAGPLLDRALQHRLAPGPPRRHGRALAQPARVPRRAGAGRLRHRRHHLQELLGPVEGALERRRDHRGAGRRSRPEPERHAGR